MNATARTTDEKQLPASRAHYMQDVMHRMHTGRWPRLKCYGVKRSSAARIYEVARWLRQRTDKPYCVLVWNFAELSIRWKDFRTLAEARKHVRSL